MAPSLDKLKTMLTVQLVRPVCLVLHSPHVRGLPWTPVCVCVVLLAAGVHHH